jgi:hypothetical protein
VPHEGVTLPNDAARGEGNRANNELQRARRERRWVWSAALATVWARREETSSEPKSLGDGDDEEDEGEEEGEVTPSPHSPPPDYLLSLGDLFRQQAGISVGTHRLKRHLMGTRASSGPPSHSDLMLVSSDLQGMSIALVVTRITNLLGVL